jgi:hypothetical protein
MEPEINQINLENRPPRRVIPLKKLLFGVLGGFGVLGILGVLGAIFIGLPGYKVYQEGMKVYDSARAIKEAAKTQDITKILESITATKSQLEVTKNSLRSLAWGEKLPLVGPYFRDADHLISAASYALEAGEITVKAVEPYQDLLGLKGKGSFTGGTTEERIALAVATLDKVTLQIDAVAEKIDLLQKEMAAVDPNRYPQKIKTQLSQGMDLIAQATKLLEEAKPLIKVLPKLMGNAGEVKYLVIFQNDAEIRPTGGFMTAYAVLRVEKGKINLDTADDIYKLDSTITKNIKPPQAIKDYLNESVFHLRNTNFSPDFAKSMEDFTYLYNSSGEKKRLTGIVAMDTAVLVRIMDVLGPIEAYGTTFTTKTVPQCDCPQIIWELEKYADEPTPYLKKERKDIIGVLLQSLMQKAMGAPKDKWTPLLEAGFNTMQEKHILVYFYDPDAQKGVEALGWAGRIRAYDGDYLHINDANLKGAKSNLYVTQSVKQDIKVTAEGTETTLTIDYKHPRKADNCSLERKSGLCLSGTLYDYMRVYLPKGSTIIETRGFEVKGTKETRGAAFEDLEKTVIDGFFSVTPLGLARIQITYKTPLRFTNEYRSLIQKQPGTDAPHYKVTVNGKTEEFDLLLDKELVISL